MSAILRWQILSIANQIDNRARNRRRRRARALSRSTFDPYSNLSAAEFLKTFRLGKESVKSLAEDLAPHMKKELRSDGLTVITKSHPLSSHMAELTSNGEQVFLLGDSGYPLRKTMLTPILNTLEGTPDHHFYEMHVTARNTVERCIGVLKARFRCLLAARALHYNPIKAGKIVNACCVLHNLANQAGTPVTSLTIDEANAEYLQQQHEEQELRTEAADILVGSNNRRVNPDLLEGRALQQAIVNRLWRERMNQ